MIIISNFVAIAFGTLNSVEPWWYVIVQDTEITQTVPPSEVYDYVN